MAHRLTLSDQAALDQIIAEMRELRDDCCSDALAGYLAVMEAGLRLDFEAQTAQLHAIRA